MEIRPKHLFYWKLLSYRYFRLDNLSLKRTYRETGKVKYCITRLILVTMKNSSGEDPILVLDVLSRFGQEAGILDMSEPQAYIALPYVLLCLAEDPLNSVRESSKGSDEMVTC